MNIFLSLAFLFASGSLFGWILELFYRRFISKANPERKWINPGFCHGPYLPIYGSGISILYLIASLEQYSSIQNEVVNKIVLFTSMAVFMTIIEYIAGIISLKFFHVRLWDYRKEKLNIQGIICPKYSFFWAILGALYYFLIHPNVLNQLNWLSENLAFSFVIGLFYGVFIVDLIYSANIIAKIKSFANEYGIIVKYENLKSKIADFKMGNNERKLFFLPFKSKRSLKDFILDLKDKSDEFIKNRKNKENK